MSIERSAEAHRWVRTEVEWLLHEMRVLVRRGDVLARRGGASAELHALRRELERLGWRVAAAVQRQEAARLASPQPTPRGARSAE